MASARTQWTARAARAACASLFLLATSAGLATEPLAVAAAMRSPRLSEAVYCLWQSANFGSNDSESAAWLVATPHGFTLEAWPVSPRAHASVWKGRVPDGAVAILHTHPQRLSPRPSQQDSAVARELSLPVSTVTRDGIFTALPDGRVVFELSREWFAAYRAMKMKECGRKAGSPDGAEESFLTTSAEFAPAAGPDSSR